MILNQTYNLQVISVISYLILGNLVDPNNIGSFYSKLVEFAVLDLNDD